MPQYRVTLHRHSEQTVTVEAADDLGAMIAAREAADPFGWDHDDAVAPDLMQVSRDGGRTWQRA